MEPNFFELIAFRPDFPVAQFHLGNMRNLIYLVLDWATKKAAIIDPQSDLDPPLRHLREHGFELTDCLLTHSHFDHVAGVPELVQSHPHLRFWVGQKDLHRLEEVSIPSSRLRTLEDGATIPVGNLFVQSLATPGHSAGEFCFFLDCDQGKFLATGDTLFIRDCGRTDFPDSSNEDMFDSLQKIKKLPKETWILPGHCYQKDFFSTLGRELKTSGPLQCATPNDLAKLP